MRKILFAIGVAGLVVAAPMLAQAQSRSTLVGAGVGAVGGAVVGGPVGAAVGGVGGAVVGSRYGSRHRVHRHRVVHHHHR